jgi:hypothetical protein
MAILPEDQRGLLNANQGQPSTQADDSQYDQNLPKNPTYPDNDVHGDGPHTQPDVTVTDPGAGGGGGPKVGDVGLPPDPNLPGLLTGGAPKAREVDVPSAYWGQNTQSLIDSVKQDVSGIGPHTREVQDNELTSHQLNKLLSSDSKYIQDARRQGLEQANAMGGLGGTAAIGASMQAAVRAGLPIAESDAQAFRAAATENLQALNQFSQLSLQRATQLELGHLDAAVRTDISRMANSIQLATSKIQSDTTIAAANLDAATKVRVQEMNQALQERLAGLNYKYQSMLNDQNNAAQMAMIDMKGQYDLANTQAQGEFNLAQEQIRGEYSLEGYAMQTELQEETNYINMVADANNTYWNMLTMYEGQDLDQDAMNRVREQAERYYTGQVGLINKMFPNQDPIEAVPPTGG